jgi:MarR family transcriptional regulator, organic hydroperoxide resistance regulator
MNRLPEPDTLDYLFAKASHLHHNRVESLLSALGLYRGQPPILSALWNQEGLTHSELAERLSVSPATISKMVQRMEKKGFVVNQADTKDQRVFRVYLTESGRAIHTRVDEIFDTIEKETFMGFTSEEKVLMRHFLTRIIKNLQQAANKEPAVNLSKKTQ